MTGRDTQAPTVLVIQPDPIDPLLRFDPWLRAEGISLSVVQPFAGDEVPHELDADGLIVLGGIMSAHDDQEHPWLEDIRVLMRSATAQGRPQLGICLGGQLLAQAHGGSVVVAAPEGVEGGVARVQLREPAAEDELFADLPEVILMGALHGDAIDRLPAGAIWLAKSDQYPHQAFRSGPCSWGVQFHPEVSPEAYAGWAHNYRSIDPEHVRRVRAGLVDFPAEDHRIGFAAEHLARRFAAVVARRPWKSTYEPSGVSNH